MTLPNYKEKFKKDVMKTVKDAINLYDKFDADFLGSKLDNNFSLTFTNYNKEYIDDFNKFMKLYQSANEKCDFKLEHYISQKCIVNEGYYSVIFHYEDYKFCFNIAFNVSAAVFKEYQKFRVENGEEVRYL